MDKKIIISAIVSVILLVATIVSGRCEDKGEAANSARFFSSALTGEEYKIALCEAFSTQGFPYKTSHFELRSGKNLLKSDYPEHSVSRQLLCVIEAIKGDFDRIVVYHEYFSYGQKNWPAFNRHYFIPVKNTKWIVVFKDDAGGEQVNFRDSEEHLPVLRLASKEFGIIRYDDTNHMGLNAKHFSEDLKLLLSYLENKQINSLDKLKTDLGEKILAEINAENN